MATAPPSPSPPAARGRHRAGGDLLGPRGGMALVAPAAVVVVVFLVVPALWALYLGTTDRRLTGVQAANPQFVGTEQYRDALGDRQFWNSLKVTLQFVFGSAILGQAVLGFTLAWLFRSWNNWARRTLELLVVLAWIIPGSVVAFLWRAYLDGDTGTLNRVLSLDTDWLVKRPMASIVVFNTWRGTAFSMLLFGAALNSLPPSYLETSRLAGATTRQQLTGVVLPSIKGYILTNLLLISLWTFNDFSPFLLTGGGPGRQTEVLPVYIWRTGIRFGDLGFGSAVAAIMMVINLAIALVYLRVGRERRA